VATAGLAASVVVDGDGSILVAYEATAGTDTALVRYGSTGAVLASWDKATLGITGAAATIRPRLAVAGSSLFALNENTVFPFSITDSTTLAAQASWTVPDIDTAEDLAVEPAGKVWVAGVSTAGNIQLARYTAAGVPEAAHTLGRQVTTVRGLTVLPNGNLYIASGATPDPAIGEVDVIAPDGTPLNLWTAQGTGNGSFQDAPDVTIAANGDVYVLDTGNNLVQVFDNNGIYQGQWALDPSGANHGDQSKLFVDGDIFIWSPGVSLDRYNSAGVYQEGWQPASPQPSNYDFTGIMDSIAANGRIYQLQMNQPGGPMGGNPDNFTLWVFEQNGTLVHEYGLQEQTGQTDRLQFARLFAVDASEDVYVGVRHNSLNKSGIYHYALSGGMYGYVKETPVLAVLGAGNPFDSVTDLDVASDGSYLLSLVTEQNGRILIHLAVDGTELQGFSQSGSEPGELFLKYLRTGIELDSMDRLFVADVGNRRIQVFEPVIQSNRAKAIIVAGGGPYAGNHLWSATQAMSNTAYRTLSYKGFRRDTIQYLSADTRRSTVDADATRANLQSALTSWALADNDGIPGPDATDVVLYITDHGGPGSMRISATETVSDTELDGWLDIVEAAIPGKVTLIYDACHAGSFTSIADPDRNLLLSSASNQVSYFIGRGILSFSQFFWSEIFAGGSLGDAFTAAQSGIANTPTTQDPELDADGDGVPNEQVDDIDALQNIFIGNGVDLFQAAPTITSVAVTTPQPIPASTATIEATGVTDGDGVNLVRATVYPPDLPPPDPENPVVGLPTFDLVESPVGSGNYSGTYDGFTSVGIYQVVVMAEDVPGNTSAPQLVTVTVGTPLARRAVLVVGGDPADAVNWPGYEAAGTSIYNALREQGYTNADITYLSGSTVNGVEQPVTLASLQSALTDAGVLNNTQDLVLYMTGPGDGLNFTLNPGEALPATSLDGWLDTLVGAIPGKLTVVMDADSAGYYLGRLSAPAGREEALYRVASTTGGTAHFQGNGSVSFTTFLAGNIANGATLNTAYKLARLAMQAASNNQQQAWLDTNSDNAADKFDGDRVKNFSLGPGILLAGDEPVIGTAGVDGFSASAVPMDVTLWAGNITTTGTLDEVWALVTPPDTDGFGGTDPAPVRVPLIWDSNLLRYQSIYNLPAPLGGTYSVTFYASDADGAVSLPWTETLAREDIYEPDDTEAQASPITIDALAQYHSFHTVNDEDWVTFDITLNTGDPPVTLAITADPVGNEADVVLDITEPDNNVIHVDQNLAGEFPEGIETYFLTVSTVGTHTYKVKVSLDTTLPNTPSDYTLAVTTDTGGNPTPTTSVQGLVTDTGGNAITIAEVTVTGVSSTTTTYSDFTATYELYESSGTYTLSAMKSGYFMDADGDGNPDPDLGTIAIPSTGSVIRNITLVPDAPVDTDGDGIPDAIEDANGNSIVDAGETDPNNPDSDGDGLCDGPNTVGGCTGGEDQNANGIVDAGETDPTNPDSDGDFFLDGEELYYGSDPLNQADTPANGDINEDGMVNAADVLLATRIITGQYTPTTDEAVRADVAPFNGTYPTPDGQVNAGDLVRIQRMAVGLP